MNARVILAIGLNLARRCKPVLLAQLYYAERELLFCCGVLVAFLGFFTGGGAFPLPPWPGPPPRAGQNAVMKTDVKQTPAELMSKF